MLRRSLPRLRWRTIVHLGLLEMVPHLHYAGLGSGIYSLLYFVLIALGSRVTAHCVAVLCVVEAITTACFIPVPDGLYPALAAAVVALLSIVGWDGPAEWFHSLPGNKASILRRLLTLLVVLLLLFATLWKSTPWVANLGFAVCFCLLRRHWPAVKTPPAPTRHVWATALLGVMSCTLALLVFEEGVRLFFHDEISRPASCNMPHPRRLWTLRPDCSGAVNVFGRHNHVVRRVTTRTSHIGLRDRDFPAKSPDEFRILMLGDSFVYGYGLEEEETIPRVLESILIPERKDKRITVINGGVWGYAPWQSRDLLNEIGFSLQPDLVIEAVFMGNDVDDTLARIGLAQRAYDDRWRRLRAVFEHRVQWNVYTEYWLRQHLHALAWSTSRFGWPRDGAIADAIADLRFVQLAPLPMLPPRENRLPAVESDLAEWYPELDAGFATMMKDLSAMRDDCRVHGADFLLVAIPPYEVVSNALWDHVVNYLSPGVKYERGKGVRRTEDAATAEGIEYIPILQTLYGASTAGPLYFEYDSHFNESGAAVTAMTIAEYLQDHYFPQ